MNIYPSLKYKNRSKKVRENGADELLYKISINTQQTNEFFKYKL